MKMEEQQIKIAEACGWTEIEPCTCHNGQFRGFAANPGQHKKHTPDYLNDLNAMHEAEKVLFFSVRQQYYQKLSEVVSNSVRISEPALFRVADIECCRATAAQRAEAFLKTLNLWEGEK